MLYTWDLSIGAPIYIKVETRSSDLWCIASFRNYKAWKAKIKPNFEKFDPYKNWAEEAKWLSRTLIIHSLKMEVLDFRQVSPFWSHNLSNATGVKNRGQISHFLPLWNLG